MMVKGERREGELDVMSTHLNDVVEEKIICLVTQFFVLLLATKNVSGEDRAPPREETKSHSPNFSSSWVEQDIADA